MLIKLLIIGAAVFFVWWFAELVSPVVLGFHDQYEEDEHATHFDRRQP